MATKTPVTDNLTMAVPVKQKDANEVRVAVFIPPLEDPGDGIKVDQYEHVTIANEQGEQNYRIHRGERVEVPIPVFEQLKLRYPNI